MVSELTIEFPLFPTHVPLSKNKFKKIGFNALYSSPHFSVRKAFVGAMHSFLEKNINKNLTIETPIQTELLLYVPVNYGNIKRLKNKETGKFYISWKKPRADYEPNWDAFNLCAVWLKAMDDVLIKRGVLADDNVSVINGTRFEVVFVDKLEERKLVYKLKTK